MGKYFGTDGFRGRVGETLTAAKAFAVGRLLAKYFKREHTAPRIVIGKDTRRSSYMLEYALTAGAASLGADVYMLHVISTPGVSYVCRTDDFDCGVMISASHNVYSDNGIKLFNRNGEKMEDEVIAFIEKGLDVGDDARDGTEMQVGKVIDYATGRNRYIAYLISLSSFSYKDLRIGLDCANGALWMIAKSVFEALGAKVYTVGTAPDGSNINREVGSMHPAALRQLVEQNRLDCGFAFDGDGDRCLCVDETGQLLTGDHILYLLSSFMTSRQVLPHHTVVATVMSNQGAIRAMRDAGVKVVFTDVGDKNVYEEMRKNGYALGGESCGHIICGKYATTGDGLLCAIQIMESMIAQKQSLSRLCAPVRLQTQLTVNLHAADRYALMENPDLQKELAPIEEELKKGGGRMLLRVSGTEPVLRLTVEHPDRSQCTAYLHRLEQCILQKQESMK